MSGNSKIEWTTHTFNPWWGCARVSPGCRFCYADDGLAQPWSGERVWCNPPYSFPNLGLWIAKAWREWMQTERPGVVVMLIPANRTEQAFWQEMVEPYRDMPGSDLRCQFLPGRTRFLVKGQSEVGPDERPPFGCCLLIWEERQADGLPRLVPELAAVVRTPKPAGQFSLFDDLGAAS